MAVGGLLTLGVGGFFYLRSSRMQQVAMAELDRAVRAEQVARAMAEKAARVARAQAAQARDSTALLEREVADDAVPGPQTTIELNEKGQLKLNGAAVDLTALADRLKAPAADKTTMLIVNVRADRTCPFQHVAAVIATCQELGITRFRIRTLDQPTAEDAPENAEPATVIR